MVAIAIIIIMTVVVIVSVVIVVIDKMRIGVGVIAAIEVVIIFFYTNIIYSTFIFLRYRIIFSINRIVISLNVWMFRTKEYLIV